MPGPALDLRSRAGSVLLDLRAADGVVDLPATGDRAVTRVLLGSSGRCDAHSLGGSTQTFLLSAYVRLGEAPEQLVVLTPTMSVQDRILDVVDETCSGRDR